MRTARTRAISSSPREFAHRRGGQLHGDARARAHLPLPHRRAVRGARPAADDRSATRRRLGTAFTVSVEAREGVTTGISAADRAHTIAVAIDPAVEAARPRPARPHLPAPRPRRRRPRPRRPDRGGRRPRAPRRPESRRRRLRDHERGRDDGARAGSRPVLRAARAQDDHRRRPIEYRRRMEKLVERVVSDAAPDGVRRVHRHRLPRDADRPRARRARDGGDRATTSSCASTPSA